MSKHPTPPQAASMDSMGARVPKEQALRLAATAPAWERTRRRTNENDLAVDRISRAMKSRLERERIRDWDDPRKFSPELLAKMLGESICDGDPVGVAVMATLLFARRVDKQLVAEHAMRALLQGSREAAAERADSFERATQTLSRINHDFTVVMQAAWIEWQHGRGAEAAMSWIHNTLAGPGNIPDEDEPYAKEAQAYFDANRHDPLPTCFCGRPSNRSWMKQGFCSEQHANEAKGRASRECKQA